MKSQKLKFVIAFTVIGGGVVFLVTGKLKDSFRYSESVAAVAQSGDALVGRNVRIQGKYVDDSLVKKRDGQKPYFEFQIAEGPVRLTVRYDDSLPDTLVNGAEVTAEGQVSKGAHFHATKVFAKCPSKYDAMPTPGSYKATDPYSVAGRGTREHPSEVKRAGVASAPVAGQPGQAPASSAPAAAGDPASRTPTSPVQ